MTVCRYFLQGTCRFGDRCRFEHTESTHGSYDARNNVGHQQRYGNQYTQSNNFQQHKQNRNDRYEYNDNRYSKQSSYSPDAYSENYRYESAPKYSGTSRNERYDSNNYYNEKQRSQSHDRYSENYRNEPEKYRQSYEQYPGYNEQSYGRNQQYQANYQQQENTYGQNRFKWLSNDYKKQAQPQIHSSNAYVNEDYSTSTPKGKVPFSFKLPESEVKKKDFSEYQVDENDQLHADLVKEDAKEWELGGLWPFTCYCPCPNKYCFPGFCDVSPEELRYAAYKAEESNAYDSYVQSVQNALLQINQQRSQLQIPTPQLLSTLRRVWDGENLCSAANIVASIPFIQCEETGTDVMDTPTTEFPANNAAAAAFSFTMPTETDSSAKQSGAAAFSFKLPAISETKLTASTVSAGDVEVYTPLQNLTEEEKEQFSASTFVLGRIPTKPPPQVFCT